MFNDCSMVHRLKHDTASQTGETRILISNIALMKKTFQIPTQLTHSSEYQYNE